MMTQEQQPPAPNGIKINSKIIAVDMDEVVSETTTALIAFHNDHYQTQYGIEHYISTEYINVWGGTLDEVLDKWAHFYRSDHFQTIQPVVGSKDALQALKDQGYSFHIVTARHQRVVDLTSSFIDKHFPGIFDGIHFANTYITAQEHALYEKRTKSQICKKIGAEVLIDDSLSNAIEASQNGIQVLLFDFNGSYPWNKHDAGDHTLHDKIKRVHNWEQVHECITSVAPGEQ